MHSTETALLKGQNDTAASMDSGEVVALTLLGISVAVDIIDHTVLFNCLRDWFDADGTVIKSYLTNRRHKVKLGLAFRMNSHSLMGSLNLPPNEVKNLDVIFDSGNTFASHITKVCHACYYHLKGFRGICKFLSVGTCQHISMISSQIEYYYSLLYGVNKYSVAKLQKI